MVKLSFSILLIEINQQHHVEIYTLNKSLLELSPY